MSQNELAKPSLPLRPAALANWLWAVAFLVIIVIAVGGITRLTESGLSITEWRPVSGVLPPLNAADWAVEFEKYKQIPEYKEINHGMSLAAFKMIFFWEWIHRILGRVIGMAMILSLAYFAWRRAIPAGYSIRLLALTALVGLQGAIGWWMVTSGLEYRTDVSHYRLATHLLTALLLLAGLVWTARDLSVLAVNPAAKPARITGRGWWIFAIVTLQLLLGAWVAGLNAGYVASSWPMMNDHLVPEGIDWSDGIWTAMTNDPFLLHFLHRWWAWVAAAAVALLALSLGKRGDKGLSHALLTVISVQLLLGIVTVVSGMSMWIAVLHQFVGAILVAVLSVGLHRDGSGAR
ncbi:MAG TPA: COX15/CtaA family protein [Sphingopyxis sp.]|nr:COX15/CtaA family protein [Sphingopyxis sp.]